MDNFIKMQSKFITQINNSRAKNAIPQAIMVESSSGLLLDRAVEYIIASLVCDDEIPCFRCENCQKVLSGGLSDLIVFDLSDEKIKKENILEIQQRFSKTALEITNKQIYVIKYIENASSIALNSLLKFLEEPNENVYAIFTTLNSSNVLETITSRTIVYKLLNNDIKKIKEVLYQDYNKRDVDLVSLLSSDEIRIKDILDSEVYKSFSDNIARLLGAIYSGNFFVVAYEQLNDLEKDDLEVFFELLYAGITNIKFLAKYNVSEEVIFKIMHSKYYSDVLDIILSARLSLETNMNKALLVDKFSIEIEGALL